MVKWGDGSIFLLVMNTTAQQTAPVASIPSTSPAAEAPKSAPRRLRAKVVFPLLIVATLGIGGTVYARGLGRESTDDAFVESHVAISSSEARGSFGSGAPGS